MTAPKERPFRKAAMRLRRQYSLATMRAALALPKDPNPMILGVLEKALERVDREAREDERKKAAEELPCPRKPGCNAKTGACYVCARRKEILSAPRRSEKKRGR